MKVYEYVAKSSLRLMKKEEVEQVHEELKGLATTWRKGTASTFLYFFRQLSFTST